MATRDPDFPLVAHFTEPHVRLQASGTLGSNGGNEIWTVGMKVVCFSQATPTFPDIATQADVADVANAGLTAFTNLLASGTGGGGVTAALISSDVALTEVKAYAVGPDNHADSARQTEYRFPAAPVTGQAGPTANFPNNGRFPYAVSVVVTFKGALYRKSLAAFGRIYLPGANISADLAGAAPKALVNGLMDPGTVQGFVTAGAALVHTINNAPITGTLLKVVANVGTTVKMQSLVRWQPVTIVTVDNRPDTVRRRQNKIGGRGKITIAV